jgi:hypothetical protein
MLDHAILEPETLPEDDGGSYYSSDEKEDRVVS